MSSSTAATILSIISSSRTSARTEKSIFNKISSETSEDITLLKLLGKGKFPVFLAFSPSKNKYFAMKIFELEDDKPSKYFQNEARFLYLEHPNVIGYHHAEEQTSISIDDPEKMASCLIMEYASYGDISSLIHKSGEDFTERFARTYFRQLIEGIEYLHSVGVCHFDLKPKNLLIGQDGNLKIADFDLSYVEGDHKIQSRGTKYYRAPELKAHKGKAGAPADVYAAGIMLFLLKCKGTKPHKEEKKYNDYDLLKLLNTNVDEFFKAHCVVQKKASCFFDDNFKDLFIAMTRPEPEARMSIRDIKSSKWYRGPVYSPVELARKIKELYGF